MRTMRIKVILMDVDGTMTNPGGENRIMDQTPLEHLVQFVMTRHGVSAQEAMRKILDCGNPELCCLSELLPKLGIDEEPYFQALKKDLAEHISIPDDTLSFLRAMKEKGIPVCAATTNSRFMVLAKLAVRGIADRNGCEYLSAFHSGNEFQDPRGKFSGNYFPNILNCHGYPPDRTIMIGDEPEYDLHPALKAGIRYAAILRRDQKESLLLRDGGMFVNSLEVLADRMEKAD